jgi:DNA-binding transcriptional LysR family regulator
MSRALSRLREVTGDPLLVRAGRSLVPTPRALELRLQVGPVVEAANAVLRPAEQLDLSRLQRRFTLRTSEGFVETFGPNLLEQLRAEAPGVILQFVAKPDKQSAPLREGEVDIETGVIDPTTGPEMRAAPLFADRWVGVVRVGHPLTSDPMTLNRYSKAEHVHVMRRGLHSTDIDDAVQATGHTRSIAMIVHGFSAALFLARQTNLVATVPERHTAGLRRGMFAFPLPLAVPTFTLSMLWHPRMDGDLAHRWLRGHVKRVCADKRHTSFDPQPS